MKFRIENLGRLDKAELEVADLTVICGENSTGKTYATYAFYGFLRMWANGPMSPHPVALSAAHALPQTGVQRVDLIKDLLPTAKEYFEEMSALYNNQLAKVFASREDYFADSSIHFTPDDIVPDVSPEYTHTVKVGSTTALIFFKEEGSTLLEITRPSGLNKPIPVFAVANLIDDVFRKLVWSQIVPEVFISSTERTGAAVFQRSLNFARDKAMSALTQMEANRQQNDPQAFVTQLFVDYQADYPLPVEDNVRLLGNLEQISKSTGKIASNHPEILKAFDAIVGGSYKSTKEGVYYIPKGSKVRLTMSESSSIVRSLLDFGFYLRHILKPGDLLIMDEPEMSLHPANQRLLTRLLARLVNAGVKVFLTTHSDYILREFNTLIVGQGHRERINAALGKEIYQEENFIAHDRVRLYTATDEKQTDNETGKKTLVHILRQEEIDPNEGMMVGSFDDEIDAMNLVQDILIQMKEEELA